MPNFEARCWTAAPSLRPTTYLIDKGKPRIDGKSVALEKLPAPIMAPTTATALSDQLITELQSANILLLTVPMYNFSIPSSLKAWIDQIVRIGYTFSYDGKTFGGLVRVQQAYVLCAYGAGGYTDGGPFSGYNFLQPYLNALLSFLGISKVQFFSVQATTADASTVANNMEMGKRQIDEAIVQTSTAQVRQVKSAAS